MAKLPPPPLLPRAWQESGVFEIDDLEGRPSDEEMAFPLVTRQRVLTPVVQPIGKVIPLPYRDDWKSAPWILSYIAVFGTVIWILISIRH